MSNFRDITGNKFNRLTAIEFVEKRKLGKKKYPFWLFKCDCGNKKIINKYSVTKSQTKSCGCLHKENVPKLKKYEGSLNTLIYTYKSNAKKRNIEYNLDKEDFRRITSGNCYYCNQPPTKVFKRPPSANKFNGNYSYNGIDRVDNNKGYIIDNCVSCCEICNRAKLKLTKKDFLDHVLKIYNHVLKKDIK